MRRTNRLPAGYQSAAARIGCFALGCLSFPLCFAQQSPGAADTVYRNGYVYTVDAHDSVQEAVAVRDGVIVFVGSNAGVASWVGARTVIEDLHGRMLMPGLVDGHMHPLAGGRTLTGCDLKYERLTAAAVRARIAQCLEVSRDREPDGWLRVNNWFQEAMIGGGVMSRRDLDTLQTRRPIFVLSSFGHTALVNTRALELAHISASTPDPLGGQIPRDAAGQPTGLLQDAAFAPVEKAIPPPTSAEDMDSAVAALTAMRAQGVTTFFDAAASPDTLAAFAGAQKRGALTARAHFAVLVKPT
jgi:predicted amidohydrolase YtcJ